MVRAISAVSLRVRDSGTSRTPMWYTIADPRQPAGQRTRRGDGDRSDGRRGASQADAGGDAEAGDDEDGLAQRARVGFDRLVGRGVHPHRTEDASREVHDVPFRRPGAVPSRLRNSGTGAADQAVTGHALLAGLGRRRNVPPGGEKLAASHVRRLPVLGPGGALLGIPSIDDIMRWAARAPSTDPPRVAVLDVLETSSIGPAPPARTRGTRQLPPGHSITARDPRSSAVPDPEPTPDLARPEIESSRVFTATVDASVAAGQASGSFAAVVARRSRETATTCGLPCRHVL
jgi:hypothetical protein